MKIIALLVPLALVAAGALAQEAGEATGVLPAVAAAAGTEVQPATNPDSTGAAQGAEDQDEGLIRDGTTARLSDFLWIKRPVIVFADTPADPRFVRQMELLEEAPEQLLERDVVVLVDTDPAARSELRRKFRPHGFMLVLMGKDGIVYLRKPFPWSVREISRSIDKMPIRQQELDERRRGGG